MHKSFELISIFYLSGWWIEYALDYCYIQNTYFIPFTDVVPDNYWDIAEHVIPIPKNVTQREDRLIGLIILLFCYKVEF